MSVKYTIAICTKNDVTYDCLDCLTEINKQISKSGAVLLIEDCTENKLYSQHTLRQHISRTPHVKYIKVANREIGHSRNTALKRARSDIIVFIDDDVRVTPNYIRTMLAFFSRHPKAVGYANAFRPLHNSPWSAVACASWSRGLQAIEKPVVIPAYASACLALRIRFIKKHHITFNTGFQRNGEDIDFCLKITEHGGAIYFDPSLVHIHSFPTTLTAFVKKHIDYAEKYKRLTSLHPVTYPMVENIYNYIPRRYTYPVIKYVVITKKILQQTVSFIADMDIPFYYFFYVIILMLSYAIGIERGKK